MPNTGSACRCLQLNRAEPAMEESGRGGFLTGLDIASVEERAKQEARATRFAALPTLPPSTDQQRKRREQRFGLAKKSIDDFVRER